MKLRKGDTIQMITGNDRGKTGRISSVNPTRAQIIVEGINMRKIHRRARRQGQKGEVVSAPRPFQASRAMIYCATCQKGVRIGYDTGENGIKKRVCKKCNEAI